MKKFCSFMMIGLVLTGCGNATGGNSAEDEINDSKTPLHLLKPDYVTPYGELSPDSVKADIDRVFAYIDNVTPAKVVDRDGKTVENLEQLPDSALLNQGTYRLTSYEWAVMYMA
ncbi:MAG: glycoside hydrolase family 88 protein, partial [Muribaculaceae bacterium]|nr:glycoside hydrolase family 88 protein [Muribaculaceae bacterium]